MNQLPDTQSQDTQAQANGRQTTLVDTNRVWCDGAGDIRGGADFRSAALGHPRVYIEIDATGQADCGYCDQRFVLRQGAAHG